MFMRYKQACPPLACENIEIFPSFHVLHFNMIDLKPYSRILPVSQFVLLNLTLGAGTILILLNAGAYLPMLPYISGTTGQSISYVVWGQSDYFTAMGAALLIARALMRRFGPKRVAIFAYLLFAAACAAALITTPVFALYTSVRVMQGFAAGLSITPSLFLLLEYYREDRQKTAVSLWGFSLFMPFSIGPVLGGWLAYEMGDWRLLFILSFFISLFVAGILWALLADWEDKVDTTFSLMSSMWLFFLFFATALTLQEFFDVGLLSDLATPLPILWWLGFAFFLFAWLFWHENDRSDNPLVHFSLFTHPNYALGMLILCLAFMCFQGATVQYIIRLQLVEGYTAWHVGLLFLPLFIFSKPLSVLCSKLIDKGYDPRLLAFISLATFAISFWWIAGYIRPATWESLLWPQFLEGAALGMFFVSMTAIALSHVPKPDQLHAVDMLNTVRNIAAGLAITFSDLGWDHLLNFEQNRLISPDASNAWRFTTLFNDTTQLMHEKISFQASLLTFNDLFYFLSLVFVILAALIWFARPFHQKKSDPDMLLFETLGEEP